MRQRGIFVATTQAVSALLRKEPQCANASSIERQGDSETCDKETKRHMVMEKNLNEEGCSDEDRNSEH